MILLTYKYNEVVTGVFKMFRVYVDISEQDD